MNVLSKTQTIEYILENNCSLARLGNGEMDIILGDNKHFQKYDPTLAKELKKIRTTNNMLLCVPCLLENKSLLNNQNNNFYKQHRKQTLYYWRKYYNSNKILGDACISRFYIDAKDKSGVNDYINLLSQLWDKRDIVFIEGMYSKLGYGNDLFKNAKSISRIICPPENAYSKINEIETYVKNNIDNNRLLILALGPTATVLVKRLSEIGFQALDLGHVDIEYEWYLRGVQEKTPIDGKYVNEVAAGKNPADIVNNEYLKQIVTVII